MVEDGADAGRPEGMPKMRREGGGVFSRGAGASRALVMVLEAAECRRRAEICLGRFILRHAVAATFSCLSFSACLPTRRLRIVRL